MSLILDSLKKVNSTKKSGNAVPPSLLNLKPSGSRGKAPRKSLLVLLAVAVIGFIIVLFMPTDDSRYKVNAAGGIKQDVPQAVQPVAVKKPASDTQPKETPAPEYDPTAANKQRLAAMNSLPEINKPAPTPAPLPVPAPAPEQQTAPTPMPEPQPTTPSTVPAQPVQKSNPSFVLTGRAKREYDRMIDYNTMTAQAASALRSGNSRKAEELYGKALAEKVTKPSLTGLLTAKIRQGKVNEIQGIINNYSYTADSSVISAAALEISDMGYTEQALNLLSANSSKAGSGQIYYTAGIIQENSADYAKAETAYKKAVQSAPGDSYFLYAYARILDVQKKYEDALTGYARLAEMPSAESGLRNSAQQRASAIQTYLDSIRKDK
ncbi:tetratricopeptide repeat protein [Seleniivibrio sp.]|uniref:tetratricopeptide repeat protein n=1 Tax=Seleniivibrio sp. TaxID=2898801 RepID=UPI0025CDC343|nr:tetratricopeptide repeat protein [Seleniivibrio sp.]MCD8553796.1 tetratricopeptide repeat protein [Seleniivibrio sp.]